MQCILNKVNNDEVDIQDKLHIANVISLCKVLQLLNEVLFDLKFLLFLFKTCHNIIVKLFFVRLLTDLK